MACTIHGKNEINLMALYSTFCKNSNVHKKISLVIIFN